MRSIRGVRLQPDAPGIASDAGSDSARLRAYRPRVRLESTGVPGIVSAECGGQFFVLMVVFGGWAVYTGSGARKLGVAATLPVALDFLPELGSSRGRHAA